MQVVIMAKRSELRDKAYELWVASGGRRKLKDIALELGIEAHKVSKYKYMDSWKMPKRTKKHTSNYKGNKNALKTGENETIYYELLDEKEREIYNRVQQETTAAINEEIAILTIREIRIMRRLANIQKTETKTKITNEYKYDKKGERYKYKTYEETESNINELVAMENALTRVQEKKARLIESRERIRQNEKNLELKEQKLKQEEW